MEKQYHTSSYALVKFELCFKLWKPKTDLRPYSTARAPM